MSQLNYPEVQDERETDVKWLESSSQILEELEHDFRGQEYVKIKDGYAWKATGEAMMNDKGIRFVLSSIRHLTNRNTFMSALKPQRVNDICFDTETSIATTLFLKAEEYGISASYFDVINVKIANVIELALRRAENAGDRKAITGMTQNITKQEIKQIEPERQEEGLSRFKNW